MSKRPEQPYGPGAICENCGHFAERHGPDGCDTKDLIKLKIRTDPCSCQAMLWQGVEWPRPWLDAPEGLTAE